MTIVMMVRRIVGVRVRRCVGGVTTGLNGSEGCSGTDACGGAAGVASGRVDVVIVIKFSTMESYGCSVVCFQYTAGRSAFNSG